MSILRTTQYGILALLLVPQLACSQDRTRAAEQPSAISIKALEPVMHPSMTLLTVRVPISKIRDELEAATPRDDRGSQPDPIGNPVVDDILEWHFTRGPLAVASRDGTIHAGAQISGTIRVRGNVRLVRGTVGRILGRLNPTNVPFSAHADLRVAVAAQMNPQLLPSWRLQPNLSATARVQEASVPIRNVGDISVRGHAQRAIDGKLASLRDSLEQKLRSDDRIEKEARKAWRRLCQAYPLDVDGDGKPDSFLRVKPVFARAAQPLVDTMGMTLQIGVESNVEISDNSAVPQCIFPEVLQLLPIEEARFHLVLPIDLPFATLERLMASRLPTTITRRDLGLEATVASVTLKALDPNRLLLIMQARVGETRWFFGKAIEGTIYLAAKPKLDTVAQRVGFEDVTLDVKSRDFLGLTDTLFKGVAPMLESWIAGNLQLDLKAETPKLAAMVAAAVGNFNRRSDDIEVSARFDPATLSAITFDARVLRLVAETRGQIQLTAK